MGKGSRRQTRTKKNRRTSDTHNAAAKTDMRSFQQDSRHQDDDEEDPVVPEDPVEAPTVIEVLDNHAAKENLKIRLLYGCPVCILTTAKTEAFPYPNAMTLSWLCPVNNQGIFTFSINEKRHTATRLHAAYMAGEEGGAEASGAEFVLSVPVQGMEETLLGIGSSSGAKGNKLERLSVPLCVPGWSPLPGEGEAFSEVNPFAGLGGEEEEEDDDDEEDKEEEQTGGNASTAANPFAALEDEDEEEEKATIKVEAKRKRESSFPPGLSHDKKKRQKGHQEAPAAYPVEHLVAIPAAVAHMVCQVREMRAVEGQWLCTAMLERVFVRPEYWNGKVFMPKSPDTPPFMSFIGSQKFGYVQVPMGPGTKAEPKA